MIADISLTYGSYFKGHINNMTCYYLINKLRGVKKYEQLSAWAANVKNDIFNIIFFLFRLFTVVYARTKLIYLELELTII
jgi:hypothetical protein